MFSNVALDNVTIILLIDGKTNNMNDNLISMAVNDGTILFTDSFIRDFYNISYYGDFY